MNTVSASVILNDAQRLMRWDTTQLEDTDQADLFMAFSKALQEVWDEWWWEELMTCERTQLRDTYASATTYAAGDEVYFPATRKYYLALQNDLLAQAPALLDGTSGEYAVNEEFWAECSLTLPEAEDYVAGDEYAVADLVRDPGTDLIYSRLGGLTVSGAGEATMNGTYRRRAADYGGRATYAQGNHGIAGTSPNIYWSDPDHWIFGKGNGQSYQAYEDAVTPDRVVTWGDFNGIALPLPTVDRTGAPGDEDLWGLVNEFDPTLETARTVRMVSRLDPRNSHNPGPYDFDRTADGLRLEEIPEKSPFVWARRVTPIIADDCADFSATATYTATPANQLVFDS